jgi:cell division protein FtsW (lipid II flippase)
MRAFAAATFGKSQCYRLPVSEFLYSDEQLPACMHAGGRRRKFASMQARFRSHLPMLLAALTAALGGVVMTLGEATPSRISLHLLALALGIAAYAVLVRRDGHGSVARALVLGATPLATCATLLAPGIDGIHRWLPLASIQVHPSALLGPATLMALTALGTHHRALACILLLAMQLLHLAQPDAGQASAWAMGGVTACIAMARFDLTSFATSTALLALAVATWLRPDPLPIVPCVEDVVQRAFALNSALGALSVGALISLSLSPLLAARIGDAPKGAAAALSAYLAASTIVVAFGNFPTPVLGFGPSPLMGPLLGLAMLARTGHAARR